MYEQILSDIANFKIRGAETICKWGVLAFSLKVKELNEKCSFITTYVNALDKSKSEILSVRSNEVALINSLNYIFDKKKYSKTQTLDEIKLSVENRLKAIESRLNYSQIKISTLGSIKIKEGMSVYTHGHSSLVENLIEETHKKVNFNLNITDSLIPIKDYVKSISSFMQVKYYPFYMLENVILNSDIILIGCTAVKKKKFLCQAGSSAIVSLAKVFGVPVYVVCDLLKYSSDNTYDLEVLSEDEIFAGAPKYVKVIANELDLVEGKLLKGIICEEGILNLSDFESIAKRELNIK